ncbi:ABC transporter ATP-binding protein [Paraburkholderia elongata]|uniref:ABC transporter ATP-binding protein n=1 Tax=Paraburkholderia elongata TaxID=2675747 RepID=UPI0038B230D2
MVRQPAVFLMDEPLSNLDAALRVSMRASIKALHQSMQTTFVYVTHDQAEALTLADRIVVMRQGVVQQIGSPDDIYERPANKFVANFLGSPPINFIDGVLMQGDHGLHFRSGDLSLALDEETQRLLAGCSGRAVSAGIRAEDIDEHGDSTDCSLTGDIASLLPVGSDQFIGLHCLGQSMFFRVGKERSCKVGERVSLSINRRRLHLFDQASGVNLKAQNA